MAYSSVNLGSVKPSLTSFTPTISVTTNCTRTGNWYKNSDGQMVINYRLAWSGASGGAGAALTLNMPTGYTIDSSRYLGTFDGVETTATIVPLQGYFFNNGTNVEGFGLYCNSTSQFKMHRNYNGILLDNGLSTGDKIDVTVTLWVTGPGF